MTPKLKAVFVTGSRDWPYTNEGVIHDWLDSQDADIAFTPAPVLIHGDARGVDKIAHSFAVENSWPVIRMPADWSLGKGAGMLRNAHMVELLILLWRSGYDIAVGGFPIGRSVGTRGCLKLVRSEFTRLGISQDLIHVVEGEL
jgi:hypothetical protein